MKKREAVAGKLNEMFRNEEISSEKMNYLVGGDADPGGGQGGTGGDWDPNGNG